MKTRDGKNIQSKGAANALPGSIKTSQVGSTVKAINEAVEKRGLKKKPGQSG